jgi:hypothetical protein
MTAVVLSSNEERLLSDESEYGRVELKQLDITCLCNTIFAATTYHASAC